MGVTTRHLFLVLLTGCGPILSGCGGSATDDPDSVVGDPSTDETNVVETPPVDPWEAEPILESVTVTNEDWAPDASLLETLQPAIEFEGHTIRLPEGYEAKEKKLEMEMGRWGAPNPSVPGTSNLIALFLRSKTKPTPAEIETEIQSTIRNADEYTVERGRLGGQRAYRVVSRKGEGADAFHSVNYHVVLDKQWIFILIGSRSAPDTEQLQLLESSARTFGLAGGS